MFVRNYELDVGTAAMSIVAPVVSTGSAVRLRLLCGIEAEDSRDCRERVPGLARSWGKQEFLCLDGFMRRRKD